MAEYLTKDEIRNYPLSNGSTVDLVALIDTCVPADWRMPVMEELAVGQVAYAAAMGEMRRGVITKLGRTKVHVTFTTQGAIDYANRYLSAGGDRDNPYRVQTTADSASAIRVAPLSVPEIPADQCGCDRNPIGHSREEHPSKLDGPVEDPRQWATEGTEYPYPADRQRDAELDEIAASEEQDVATWEKQVEELDQELDNSEDAFGDLEQAEAELTEEATVPAELVTGSAIVAVLEETWEAIRANHPDLPHVVIVTGSGFIGSPRWAHWRESGWTERKGAEEHAHTRHGEMFVAGESLARGAKHVVESMLHEGAHTLATVRQVQDTSRQGRWHNGVFRKLAQELGLEFRGDKADPTHGFSNMLLTDETEAKYAELITKLDEAIRAVIRVPAFVAGASDEQGGGEYIHGGKRPKAEGSSSSTNNLKLTCMCVDEDGNDRPRIIRASKAVAEIGQILCTKCDEYFEDRS